MFIYELVLVEISANSIEFNKNCDININILVLDKTAIFLLF
jgi:hypothetical protein